MYTKTKANNRKQMPDNPLPSVPGFTHSEDQAPPEIQTNNLNKTNAGFNIELNMTGQ
jgi:hypothetical protein